MTKSLFFLPLCFIPLADAPYVELAERMGAVGILAFVVWFVFVKHLPTLVKANEESREKFLAALEAQRKHDEEQRVTSSKQQWARARTIAESVDRLTDKIDQMK